MNMSICPDCGLKRILVTDADLNNEFVNPWHCPNCDEKEEEYILDIDDQE